MILEYLPLLLALLLMTETTVAIPGPIGYLYNRYSRHSLVKLLDKEGASLEDVPGSFLPQELDQEVSRRKKVNKLKRNLKTKRCVICE